MRVDQSELDPFRFLKKDLMCVVYIDDTIITGPNPTAIGKLITSLGISDEEHHHTFDLRDEGEVGNFVQEYRH